VIEHTEEMHMIEADAELRVAPARSLSRADLEQLLPIYIESFPPSERVPFDLFLARVEEGQWLLYLAHVAADLVAFAVRIHLPGTSADLLGFLAVRRDRRNQGIGAQVLRWLASDLRQEGQVSGLVLEVESDDAGTDEERRWRRRRIGFYRRNGAVQIEGTAHFYAPSAVDDSLIEEKLLWLPITAGLPTGGCLRQVLLGIYRQGYDLGEDDPLVVRELAASQPELPQAREIGTGN
jgi:ribosomal protein S18 acetylase RimI-like enzyme